VKNAVDRATAAALADAFRAFDRDDDARVAVLAGEGGTFCAGADLKALAAGQGNRLDVQGDGPMGPTRLLLSKPVVAAVSGHAVGGGLELALWCDLRVVEEDAVLGFLNRRWGVPLIDGGTARLPRLVGLSRALDLVLTGREVRAAEALAMGLANRVVPKGGALAAAQALARELAGLPQAALRGDRLATLHAAGLPLAEAIANEWRLGQAALASEALEGARRFAKRDHSSSR
jgi:enoyl-CoA hydratase